MSDISKKDLVELEEGLSRKIERQGAELRKEIKEQGIELRKEIKESADSILEVIGQMAQTTHGQLGEIRDEIEQIKLDLSMIKREINNLNSDIDKAYKNKDITDTETTALIAGQKRLERWVEQIAKETGITLATR